MQQPGGSAGFAQNAIGCAGVFELAAGSA